MEFSKKIRVLIADDESLISDVIQQRLEESGYAVAGRAGNGQQAVELAQSARPDIILMDIRMPVMDGVEAARRIRGIDKHDAASVPIVAMTANAMDEDRKMSRDAGMNGHLAKPIDVDELQRVLEFWLN